MLQKVDLVVLTLTAVRLDQHLSEMTAGQLPEEGQGEQQDVYKLR